MLSDISMAGRLLPLLRGLIKQWPTETPPIARVGVIALYAFVLGGFLSVSLQEIGFWFLLIAFAARPPLPWRELLRQPVIPVVVVFLLYVSMRTIWAIWEFPESAGEQIRMGFAWAGLCSFVVIGSWVEPRRVPILAGLALAGLLLGAAYRQEWAELRSLLQGGRGGFGYTIPQAGLFTAVAATGLLAFAPRIWRVEKGGLSFGRLLTWSILFGVVVEMLLITQSRASWIAIIVVAVAGGAWIAQRAWIGRTIFVRGRFLWVPVLLIAVLLGLLLKANHGVIEKRLGAPGHYLLWETNGPKDAALEVRFILWRHGLEQWAQRPVFGWGPGTRVARSTPGLPNTTGHLHNAYLELLVRLGVAGAALLAAVFWLVGHSVVRSFRAGAMPPDHLLFLAGTTVALLLWGTVNFRFTSEVRFLIVMLLSIGFSFALHGSRPTLTEYRPVAQEECSERRSH